MGLMDKNNSEMIFIHNKIGVSLPIFGFYKNEAKSPL